NCPAQSGPGRGGSEARAGEGGGGGRARGQPWVEDTCRSWSDLSQCHPHLEYSGNRGAEHRAQHHCPGRAGGHGARRARNASRHGASNQPVTGQRGECYAKASSCMTPGTLYIVATPIGNLEDITLRALQVLRAVDLIACEAPRYSARLLAHYGIIKPRESYHDHNERERTPFLLQMLHSGRNIGLISDSGSPLISDPGYVLVSACRKEGIPVVPIPGPSAVIAALAGSGLPMSRFYFVGFLPPRSKARKAELEQLRDIPATLIFYEAPHRLLATLADISAILGSRPACLARELTKMHEEGTRGTLTELLQIMHARPT